MYLPTFLPTCDNTSRLENGQNINIIY